MELINKDCFDAFETMKDKSVDMFLLDLPYNCTALNWDKDIIDLEKMWLEIKRTMKPNAIIVMFCTAKFGYRLIHSNPKWFRYDLIWKKSRKVGFLSANKMPLRQHENIYIFKDKQGTYNPQKTEGKPYNKNTKGVKTDCFNKSYYQSTMKYKPVENDGFRHPTSVIEHENIYVFKDKQGTYNPQKTEGKPYNKTNTGNNNKDSCAYGEVDRSSHLEGEGNRKINTGDRHPTSIIEHENIYVFKDKQGTYNPQKTKRDKDYKHSGKRSSEEHYGNVLECKKEYKKEDGMHPTSIIEHELENTVLEFKNPSKNIHKTQKPVELCEWLIRTYTNENDVVCDFTMGSGTVGVACINTKRQFIGVEKDEEIFTLAENRINELINLSLEYNDKDVQAEVQQEIQPTD